MNTMQYGWAHGKVCLFIKIICLFNLQNRKDLCQLFALQKKACMRSGQKEFGFSTETLLCRKIIRLRILCAVRFLIIKKACGLGAMLVFIIQTKKEQIIFTKQIFY